MSARTLLVARLEVSIVGQRGISEAEDLRAAFVTPTLACGILAGTAWISVSRARTTNATANDRIESVTMLLWSLFLIALSTPQTVQHDLGLLGDLDLNCLGGLRLRHEANEPLPLLAKGVAILLRQRLERLDY